MPLSHTSPNNHHTHHSTTTIPTTQPPYPPRTIHRQVAECSEATLLDTRKRGMLPQRRQDQLHTTQQCYQRLVLVCKLHMTDESKELIASLGGVETVLSAMDTHPWREDIQVFGLLALRILAPNGSWGWLSDFAE